MIGLLTDLRTHMGDSVERLIQAEDVAGKLASVVCHIDSDSVLSANCHLTECFS